MANPFNSVPFTPVGQQMPNDINQLVQQARQNPQAFEEQIKRTNPMAYQQAMQIRNSANPRAVIKQMAQAKGLNPNILRMFGIQ